MLTLVFLQQENVNKKQKKIKNINKSSYLLNNYMNFDDEEGGLKLFPQPCWGYIDLKLEKLERFSRRSI